MKIETILVVDAELGRDPLRRMVLECLTRRGLRVKIVTASEAAELLAGELRESRVLVLFAGLRQALEAWEAGVALEARAAPADGSPDVSRWLAEHGPC